LEFRSRFNGGLPSSPWVLPRVPEVGLRGLRLLNAFSPLREPPTIIPQFLVILCYIESCRLPSRQEASGFFESPSADMHFTHTYIDLYTLVVISSVYLFQQRTPAANPSYFISAYLLNFHFFGPKVYRTRAVLPALFLYASDILAAFTPDRFY
jgi:hypothetical protein